MKKKKKTVTEVHPDQAVACLAIMLEKLKVIKLQVHRRDFFDVMPIPKKAISGMSTSSGSIYYTAEKYNP